MFYMMICKEKNFIFLYFHNKKAPLLFLGSL